MHLGSRVSMSRQLEGDPRDKNYKIYERQGREFEVR